MHKLAAVLLAIAALCGGRGALGQRAEASFVLREDLPHIGCQVCEIVVQRLHHDVEALRAAAPYNKITELAVLDEIENICDHQKPGGWWMLEHDIVQRDDALVLEKQESKGKCEHECLTLQHSCVELLESEVDQDDLSALLWKGKLSTEQLQRKVCSEWTSRCSPKKNRKKVGERHDYPFVPLSKQDLQLQQLMAAMGDSGMGGFDVMDREAMLAQMAGMDPDELAQMYGGEDMPDMYGDMEDGLYDEL